MSNRETGAFALFIMVLSAPMIYNTQIPSLIILTVVGALLALAAAWGVGDG